METKSFSESTIYSHWYQHPCQQKHLKSLMNNKDSSVTFRRATAQAAVNSMFGSSGRAAAEAQPGRFRVYVTEASCVGQAVELGFF